MTDSSSIALDVQGLRKSFGSVEVLKGIDVTAHKGDVISLIGSSGSGKSTALHMLEDLDFYCVDNLPVGLLPEIIGAFHLQLVGSFEDDAGDKKQAAEREEQTAQKAAGLLYQAMIQPDADGNGELANLLFQIRKENRDESPRE